MSPRDFHAADDGGPPLSEPPARSRPFRRAARGLANLVIILVAVALFTLLGGFLWFVGTLPDKEPTLQRSADGIVALTGGTSRIADAMELLAAGRGKRLLISGVNKSTTPREIARLVPQFERLVNCCVDLDYSALNTLGNAAETRRWAREQNFQSLIIVTSSYHMPRSMAELAQQLPKVELVPYPVVSEKMRAEPWWASMPTARLLISEYLKYMVTQVRIALEPAPYQTDVARRRAGTKS